MMNVVSGCVAQPGAGSPYPAFAEYDGWQVEAVEFIGQLELPEDSLRLAITTRESRCRLLFIPICVPFTPVGQDLYNLDLDELSRDVLRLQLYYRDHGYYGTRIVPSVDPIGDEEVDVRFAIAPGDQVILRSLEVTGTEGIVEPEVLAAEIPLTVDEPFRRIGFLRSADTIQAELTGRGYAFADVLRNYSIDTIADVAEAQFIALPGPLVTVDSIIFAGADRVARETLLRQITLEPGELLRRPELAVSQRNLYDLRMIAFASLEIAPDSMQADPDSTTATVLASIIEAPQYVVDAAVGVGTVDCLRTEASWLNRNFLGGGRSLELSGHLSRIGAGEPLDWGLGRGVCSGSTAESLGSRRDILGLLNYRAAAFFEQPRLLNTRNELGVSAHWQRLTELNIYLRESMGGEVALSRDIGRDKLLYTTLAIEHGRTLANPIVFCIGFDLCVADDLDELERFRWSNSLAIAAVWNATTTGPIETSGFSTRGAVDWASPLLFSDNSYLRLIGEGALFRPIKPGWVFAGNLRLGSFLQGQLGAEGEYIPPDRRFYAGGPNSVRGFRRNELGPTAYVWTQIERDGKLVEEITASAVGGTQTVVATAEVRMPSPILREFFRFAAFVDAGQVWAPGAERGFELGAIRVTPGVGLRLATPVGPIRFDVAYNPYAPPIGPLYLVDVGSGGLTLIEERYQPPGTRGLLDLDRFVFSFAVGQAF
jgi:outer membrane protein assembly factor BamA